MVYTKLKQTAVSFLNYSETKNGQNQEKRDGVQLAELESKKMVEVMSSGRQMYQDVNEVNQKTILTSSELETKNLVSVMEKHFNWNQIFVIVTPIIVKQYIFTSV